MKTEQQYWQALANSSIEGLTVIYHERKVCVAFGGDRLYAYFDIEAEGGQPGRHRSAAMLVVDALEAQGLKTGVALAFHRDGVYQSWEAYAYERHTHESVIADSSWRKNQKHNGQEHLALLDLLERVTYSREEA